jgi:signal transduction histidine kinase
MCVRGVLDPCAYVALVHSLGAIALAVVSVAVSAICLPAQAEQGASRTRYVLVLHQFEPSVPATIDVSRGLSSLLEQPGIVLLNEYLDQTRFAAGSDLARWYKTKYAAQPVDLIVAVGGEALQFLLDWRRKLWTGVPIVFCAAFNNLGGPARLPARVTGVTVRLPVKENLALALQLLPKTRRVAFLSGSSPVDRWLARLFWDAVAAYEDRLLITDLTGMTYEELRERLEALPEDTFAIGLTMLRDGAGRQLPDPTVVQMMSARSRAPLFAPFDTVLGHGIVGGWLLSYEQVGREAAVVARRVLDGESPGSIPVTESAAVRLAFDARELDRWRIPRDRLPVGSEVMFSRPPPFFARLTTLGALGAALLVQAALIGWLLIERRRRRRFERSAREDKARIAHMNRVAIVGQLSATLAHEVNTPLAAMLNYARAARRFLDAPMARLADARASIKALEEQGERARDVVMQMRRALRKDTDDLQTADVSQVVRDGIRLVQSDAREHGVAIEAAFPVAGPQVACHPVALQQVLLNLLLNAIEAVRGQQAERCRVRIDVQVGPDSAGVVVRDWGPGVPPEQRARLFEPFYTTKCDGLGMGLSISRSIVEAHGGTIRVSSAGGGGTIFHVVLPAATAGAREATA